MGEGGRTFGRFGVNGVRVYREDDSHGYGWRVVKHTLDQRRSRYFADAVHGGRDAARAAADAYARENEALRAELLSLRRMLTVRKSSRSGVPGVSRYEADGERGPYWKVSWTDPASGRRSYKRLSVAHWGEAEAERQALLIRERAVEKARLRFKTVVEALARLEGVDIPAALTALYTSSVDRG